MREKTKKTSSERERSTAGKPVEADDPSGKSSQAGSGDMNSEELAAFNKIMGEIEETEEDHTSGSDRDKQTRPQKEAGLDPADQADADFSAELEKVVQEAGGTDSDTAADAPADTVDEDLDEDQQKAFESIMAQIEGGDDASDEAAAVDPASDSDADFSAELEKVVQEAGGTDSDTAAEVSSDATDEDLDDDQQKALESIMAQIEGGDDSDDDGASDEEVNVDPAAEPDTGSSADLEKVVEETAATQSDGVLEVQGDDSTEGLDEDQQKAFESIMAQIESGDDSDDDGVSGEEGNDDPAADSDDDFSTELENVAQSADTDESDAVEKNDQPEPEGANEEEQQQAFERIMDQIGNGDEEKTAPDTKKKEVSTAVQSEETVDEPDENATASSTDAADEDAHDISSDIDDILKEITSEDDASQLSETAVETVDMAPTDTDQTAEVIVAEDRVGGQQEEGSDLEPESNSGNTNPGDESEPPVEPENTLPQETPSVLDSNETRPPQTGSPTCSTAKPLREATSSSSKRRPKTVAALSIVMFLFALGAYYYWPSVTFFESKTSTPLSDESQSGDVVVDTQPNHQTQKLEAVAVVQPPSDRSRLKTVAQQLDHMRSELMAKQTEIEELRTYYQAGIDAEIQGIVDTVRKAGRGNMSYKTALDNPRVRLGLSAIQRRDSYIQKLVSPTDVLVWNSEELLFFSRKAGLLALMTEKTSDIDIDGFIDQADRIRERHGRALAELNIDAVSVSPLALKTIWQDIAKRLPDRSIGTPKSSGSVKTDDDTLAKKICSGDYTYRHQLTVLSSDTARCLARWKGKDLFLNELTELQPETARQLAAWDGEWLGLNGLKELSPESAIHLARWEGKGLSLNGLSRLSPRVVAILSEWQGEQIELVNVKHMAHWENPNTRLFLSEDLRRKLNSTRK